ncbi:MAG: rhodanese-like domain-containing protein [Chlorobi bacterium]|nr:rhodanese-like domain-containing protein [Chlorobiota bacterium]
MKRSIILSLLISLLFLLSCSTSTVTNIKEISAADLKAEMKIDTNLVVLDVRHPEELTGEYGHIAGVVNIPVEELEQRITELNKYKNDRIAVICRSGNRSKRATVILTDHGFNAVSVIGGMKAYNKLNEK